MASTFGQVTNPFDTLNIGGGYSDVTTGLPNFISNTIKIIFIAGGLFAFFNFIFAGFNYMTANGDQQKLENALNSINMSIVGLVVMVAAGLITGIISFLLYGDAAIILRPTINGPGSI